MVESARAFLKRPEQEITDEHLCRMRAFLKDCGWADQGLVEDVRAKIVIHTFATLDRPQPVRPKAEYPKPRNDLTPSSR